MDKDNLIAGFVITAILLIIIVLVASSSSTSESSAKQALLDAGYTNITLTGYEFWGCADDDIFHEGFEATGPAGRHVTGVVCSGWTKGSTIRLK